MADKFWTGATDGDYGTAGNWSPSGVPVASDKVYIAGSVNIDASNQSAVELDEFHVLPEYTGTIGTIDGFLQIDIELAAGKFSFAGQGVSHIDLGTANMPEAIIWNTAKVANGSGLYISGSAIPTLDLRKGDVRLLGATVTTVVQSHLTSKTGDTQLFIDEDSTVTNLRKSGGSCTLAGSLVTVISNAAGDLIIEGDDVIPTLNIQGGNVFHNGTGNITSANLKGGVLDTRRSSESRTIVTLNVDRGIFYRGENVAVTNLNGDVLKIEAVDG